MPIAGGAADKMGNQYENYWALHAMIRILANDVKSIQIEPVDFYKTDFALSFESATTEVWQTKRQTSCRYWSLKKLNDEGIFSFFQEQYRRSNIGVFASISDAPDLREILERAKHSNSWNDFKLLIDKTKKVNLNFNTIRDFIKQSPPETFAILKNSRLTHSSHDQLILSIDLSLRTLFRDQQPEKVRSILFEYYFDQIHKKLEIDDILEYLKSKGVYSTNWQQNTVKETIKKISGQYVDYQERKLISSQLIHRNIATEIIDTILNASESVNIVILGEAGSGKSGILYETICSLNEKRIPILAFRMDRLEYVTTTQKLGEQLGLKDSPAIELKCAFRETDVVILVDQLDCMSTTSGRKSDFFETFHALVKEINELRCCSNSAKFHLIIACRKFDFDNDSRFSKLFDKSDRENDKSVLKFVVDKLSEQEVKNLLKKNHHTRPLTAKQIQLLTLPQNLSLYFESFQSECSNSFDTQKDLFDRYWNYKKQILDKIGNYWNDVIKIMCLTMSEHQELSISETKLNSPCQYINTMCSEGVIFNDGKRFSFRHESFFDYCFARYLVGDEIDFVQELEDEFENGQHLFRRSQLRQYLTYIRDDNFQNYIKTIEKILISNNILSHLKFLVLSLIVSWSDVRQEEWNIIKRYVLQQYEDFRIQNTHICSVTAHAYNYFLYSPVLFSLADVQDFIQENLDSSDPVRLNSAIVFLQCQIKNYSDKVAEMLTPYLEHGTVWQERISNIIQNFDLKDNRKVFDIFLRLLQLGHYDNQICKDFHSIHITYNLSPKWMIEVIAQRFQRVLDVIVPTPNGTSPIRNEIGWRNEILNLAPSEPQFFIDKIFPLIVPLAEKFRNKKSHKKFDYDLFWDTYFFEIKIRSNMSLCNEIVDMRIYIVSLEDAFKRVSKENPEILRPYIEELKKYFLYVTNYLLLKIFVSNPKYFANDAITLINDEPERFLCDAGFNTVSNCSKFCDDTIFERIEATFLNCFLDYDRLYLDGLPYKSLNALRALNSSRIQEETLKMIQKWEDEINRKYPNVQTPQKIIRDARFDNKIKLEFSNEEWLELFKSCKKEDNQSDYYNIVYSFEKTVQDYPERFMNMAYNAPDIPDAIIETILSSMFKTDAISDEKKYQFACYAMSFNDSDLQYSLINLLGSLESIDFKQKDINYILHVALNAKTNTEESWKGEPPYYDDDPFTCGLNTPRGKAVNLLATLIQKNQNLYKQIIIDHLEQLVEIKSDSIAANVVYLLLVLWYQERELTIKFAQKLFEKVDICVLATDISEDILINLLYTDHEKFIPFIARLLNSNNAEHNKKGGELATRTRIFHDTKSAEDIFQKALKGNSDSRNGVIAIARNALAHLEHLEFGVKILTDLFNDDSETVRKEAAFCFRFLSRSERLTKPVKMLLECFIESRSFFEYPDELFTFLYKYEQPLVDLSLKAIDRFLQFYVSEKMGERSQYSQYSTVNDINKMLLRIYATSTKDHDRNKVLKLINLMCENNIFYSENLDTFER
jgi:hypothetical protein